MKATLKSLCSSAVALAFAASLALSGCSAGLTGPDAPPAAPAKTNAAAPTADTPQTSRADNGGGGTTHDADHNEMAEMR